MDNKRLEGVSNKNGLTHPPLLYWDLLSFALIGLKLYWAFALASSFHAQPANAIFSSSDPSTLRTGNDSGWCISVRVRAKDLTTGACLASRDNVAFQDIPRHDADSGSRALQQTTH